MNKMPPDSLYPEPFASLMQGWFDPNQMRRLFNTLYEPILPNGTFAGLVINQNNSTNPQVERHIVSHHSYGRQLGRLIDVVDLLVKDLPVPADKDDAARLKAFRDLKHDVDKFKAQARQSQAEHIIGELDGLSDADLKRCENAIAHLKRKRAAQ